MQSKVDNIIAVLGGISGEVDSELSRIDHFSDLTNSPAKQLESRLSAIEKRVATFPKRPPFYDQLRMFTYMVDKEFSIEQKKVVYRKAVHESIGVLPEY